MRVLTSIVLSIALLVSIALSIAACGPDAPPRRTGPVGQPPPPPSHHPVL